MIGQEVLDNPLENLVVFDARTVGLLLLKRMQDQGQDLAASIK